MATTELDLGRYKLGWSDPEQYVFKPRKGLNEDIVREMSWMKGEPDWMTRFRLRSLSLFERKPMLVDFASPALRRVLRRWSATTAERAPGARMELTEMLPGPRDCWLEDEAGRHTSELRLVAVDLTRLADR